MGGWVYIEFWRGLIYKPKIEIISPQQSQIHKICLILSSSALPWFHTGRVRISVVQLISLLHLHWKDGLWGQWWAKLPQVLEWQGWTGGSKCGMIWLECQGASETRNVPHPSTHGAPMYLWNGHSRG